MITRLFLLVPLNFMFARWCDCLEVSFISPIWSRTQNPRLRPLWKILCRGQIRIFCSPQAKVIPCWYCHIESQIKAIPSKRWPMFSGTESNSSFFRAGVGSIPRASGNAGIRVHLSLQRSTSVPTGVSWGRSQTGEKECPLWKWVMSHWHLVPPLLLFFFIFCYKNQSKGKE